MWQRRALPDLSHNIKCGNSLIGTDFCEQVSFLDDEEMYRVNPFDWESEFSEIMGAGGFDAVIGNPPYVQSRSGRVTQEDKEYYEVHYETVKYQINTYGLFLEKGIRLLKTGGLLGMIVPNYWLATDSDKCLRRFLFVDNHVQEVSNVYSVFEEATVDTLLLFVNRRQTESFPKHSLVKSLDRSLTTISERLGAIHDNSWTWERTYTVDSDSHVVSIAFSDVIHLCGDRTLGDFFAFKFGMKPYEEGKGKPPQTREMMRNKIYHSKVRESDGYERLLRAGNVKRYQLAWSGDWINYGQNLAAPRQPEILRGPRILIQRIVSGDRLDGTCTEEQFICNTDVITLKPIEEAVDREANLFFLGILLSRTCAKFLRGQNVNLDRAAYPKINANTLEGFPVPQMDLSDPSGVARCGRMVELVERMLALHEELDAARTPMKEEMVRRQIEATDRQIDRLVYDLYGLTEEEIEIVEESG